MQAIDTNVLVYSEIPTSIYHAQARSLLVGLADGELPWAIPWPCLYEFLRVVTHPRASRPPMSVQVALADLNRIVASSLLVLLSETPPHFQVMESLIRESGVSGTSSTTRISRPYVWSTASASW